MIRLSILKLTVLLGLMLVAFSVNAQQKKTINDGIGIGFQINQFQQDFGFGVQVSSPSFWNNGAVLRLKTNLVFHEHLMQGQYEWSGYQNIALGLAGYGGWVTENIRIYGEGGLMGLLPSENFSSESFVLSGYGSFGTELYASQGFHYFLEVGVAPTRARADLVPGKPSFHNGFFTTMGLRYNLSRKKSGK
jgi:hypothetical protein